MANNYFGIKLPEYKNAKHDLWQYLGPNDLHTLIGCFDDSEFINSKKNKFELFSKLIAKQLNLDAKSQKDKILIDKYFYLIKFCLDNEFNLEQISALLSVQIRTHRLAIETTFGNLDETFTFFKNALLCYTVHRPPFSINLFKPAQIQIIIDYFLNSYFKNFKFYKYVFSIGVRVDLNFKYTNQPEIPVVEDIKVDLDESIVRNESRIIEESPEEIENKPEENTELKQFVRDYLNQHLNIMKTDLLNDDLFIKNDKKSSAQVRSKSGSSGAKTPNKKS